MEFYEEALSLCCDLTINRVSPNMWQLLEVIYSVFNRDGVDYFIEMMPVLHNYVTVDTATFLANPVSRQVFVITIYQLFCNYPRSTPMELELARAKKYSVVFGIFTFYFAGLHHCIIQYVQKYA